MKIGMIGLGAMGLPIAERLLDAGHSLRVFDLAPAAVARAEAAGAVGCGTAAETMLESQALLFSLPNAAIVEGVLEVILSEKEIGVKVIADLSSIAPASARKFAAMAAEHGITYLDCPVSGGVGGAASGTLTIMAGGPEEALEQLMPIFRAIGKKVYHVGPVGTGSGIKMVNNFLLGCNMAAAAEALVLGTKIGLDLDTMQEIISNSSGRSFIIENKVPGFIRKRAFNGGFAVDLEYKDLGLAMETARQLAMPLPMGNTAVQVYETARAKGFGKEDITSLIKIWEQLMDTEVRGKEDRDGKID